MMPDAGAWMRPCGSRRPECQRVVPTELKATEVTSPIGRDASLIAPRLKSNRTIIEGSSSLRQAARPKKMLGRPAGRKILDRRLASAHLGAHCLGGAAKRR